MDNRYEELMKQQKARQEEAERAKLEQVHKDRIWDRARRDAQAHKHRTADENANNKAQQIEEREREEKKARIDGKVGQEWNVPPSPTASTPSRYDNLVKKYGGGEKDAADRLDPDSLGRAPTYKRIPDTLRDEDDAPERTLYTD